MVFNNIIVNPPYETSLHLKILANIININSDSKIVCLHPASWYEDTIYMYKNKSDHKRFQNDIVDKMSSVSIFELKQFKQLFPGSKINTDLMISCFNTAKKSLSIFRNEYNFIPDIIEKVESIVSKKGNNIWDNMDYQNGKVDGWRCVVYEMVPQSWDTSIQWACTLVSLTFDNVYLDGRTKKGTWWAVARKSPRGAREEGEPFQCSVKFNTEQEALNFEKSLKATFIRNFEYLIKFNAKTQVSYVPYMHDYTKVWKNDSYCKYFSLNEKEAEFMKSNISDLRIKNFINYEKL